jgi:hypothetical protein
MHHVVIILVVVVTAMLTFVLFHNVTQSTDSLLSCTHVNTTYLLNIMCTLVASCVDGS